MIDRLLQALILWRGTHRYKSTACLHGGDWHGYCEAPTVNRDDSWSVIGHSYTTERNGPKNPASCKFCSAPCRCKCHKRRKRRG